MPLDDAISALNLLRPAAKLIPVAGPYLEGTADLLLEGCSLARDAASNKKDLLALAERAVRCMIVVIEKTQAWSEPEIDSRMRTIRELERLTEELQRIARKRAQRGLRSTIRSTLRDKGDIEDLNKRFGQVIERFGVEAQLVMVYDIGHALERVKELQESQHQMKEAHIRAEQAQIRTEQNALLDKLRPVTTARYDHQNSPRGCTENTRVNIIDRIFNWALDKSAPESILWLSGLAGTGKTAIMKTLSVMLAEEGVLGGCFFISLQYTDSRDPQNVFRSLIHQLAEFQPALREPICSILHDYPTVVDQEMIVQIPKLLSEIFAQMDYKVERPVVLMIDGLDECEKRDDVEGRHFLPILLHVILQHSDELRLIITSRLISKIQYILLAIPPQRLRHYEIDSETVADDIELYLRAELQKITTTRGLDDPDWYTSIDVAKLVTLSGNFFIYAFTVVTWLNHPQFQPKDRLRQLLQWRPRNGLKSPYTNLYNFYSLILQTAIGSDPGDHEEIEERMRLLVELLVVAFRPLSVPELAALLKREQPLVRLDLDRLSSVLLVPETNSANPVFFYHASFIEYLTEPSNFAAQSTFCISEWEAHGRVSHYCLDLHYYHNKNEDSNDVPDSEANSESAIDYASRYWRRHISLSPIPSKFVVHAIGEARRLVSTYNEETRFLSDLSFLLSIHYARSYKIEIILEKIMISRRLLSSSSPSDHGWDDLLFDLAFGLRSLYDRNGEQEVLAEAVQVYQQVLELCPPGHPKRDSYLTDLANGLSALYEHNGKQELLDEAIRHCQEALELCPLGHPRRGSSLDNLALGLKLLYERKGKQEALDEAIQLHREALKLCPPGHPRRDLYLNNLAVGLWSLYGRNGKQEVLDEAIELYRETHELRPLGHFTRDASLNNLASGLKLLYECNGNDEVLDEAVQLYREALDLRPPGHPTRDISLNNLASALKLLYELNGKQEVLDEAVQLNREALDLCPSGHLKRSAFLNNLASGLAALHEHNGKQEVLDEAIQLYREALELHPPGHPGRDTSLNHLAMGLSCLYERNKKQELLDEIVRLNREALELRPPEHPHRSLSLDELAYSLCLQYEQTKSAALVEEAVQLGREALSLCSPTHINYVSFVRGLGESLEMYSTAFGDEASAKEAEQLFEQADALENTI